MTSELRKRATFKFASESYNEDNHILDEQEQEELITNLRNENLTSDRQYLLVLQVIVALSCLLHLIFLVNKTNPLLVFFSSAEPETPIPLLVPFTLLAILIHLDLGFLLYPNRTIINGIAPLSYPPLFGLSAMSPCLSIVLGRSWLTVAWWSATGGVVWLARTVQQWIDNGDQIITELEGMKYMAPGA